MIAVTELFDVCGGIWILAKRPTVGAVLAAEAWPKLRRKKSEVRSAEKSVFRGCETDHDDEPDNPVTSPPCYLAQLEETMKIRPSFLLSGFLMAAAMVAVSSPALAVPDGSYLKTCQNISQTQSTVLARCENGRGFLRAISINLDRCQPGVGLDNIYGVLTCHSRLPSGSYRQSCSDAVVMDGFLRASCLTRSGQVNGSQIRLDACSRGDIANINGQLLCVDS